MFLLIRMLIENQGAEHLNICRKNRNESSLGTEYRNIC